MDDQPPGSLSIPPRERSRIDEEVVEAAPARRPAQTAVTRPGAGTGLRSVLWLLLVLLVVAGLVAWVVLRGKEPAPTGRFQSSGPMSVGTAKAEKADMPIVLSALGTVSPLATVTVKTQIAGQLVEVAFKEGQLVNKGDLLAQIDPRPYQVALAQAEGQLARDQALLKNAELDLARYRTLVAQNSIARQTLDTQAALVQQNRGTVQADQAQVDAQKLNLTYCRIIAPISGRVGLRQVDPGNYAQTSDPNGIVVITQLQPISVIFTLPEDHLPPVQRRLNSGAALTVTAYDRTGATKLDTGTLQTLDNQIDTSTGTVKLRAAFDNKEQLLFPNQFVNVRLLVDTLHDATTVPTAAIQRGAPGTFVYLVKPDDTVTAQAVTLGPSDNQRVALTKGVEPGQSVVTDGADRLKDGAKVRLAGAGQPPSGAPGSAGARPEKAPTELDRPPAAAAEKMRGQGGGAGRRRGGE